ncbi:hypothetical protein ACEPAG_4263 [Sanghuangporus baumii]
MPVGLENLLDAVSSIPHIGQILAVTITIGVAIYKEAENLEPSLKAEQKLAEEAEYILRSIGSYSQKLMACDPIHLKKLEGIIREMNEVAEQARLHMFETACARDRHRRRYGKTAAEVYECLVKPSDVWNLERKLDEVKDKFTKELAYISALGGHRIDTCPPPYRTDEKEDLCTEKNSERVRWVNVREVEGDPDTFAKLVPVCQLMDSENHEMWYIARVSYYGSFQPGKYRPGHGAYFGYRREALQATDFDFDVLVAEPGSICWKSMSGTFTESHFERLSPVKGCQENDRSRLAIVRAWAKEHMKIGIFTDKAIQPGKAGPKLECAYVIAGKEEKKIEKYDVLVYTAMAGLRTS